MGRWRWWGLAIVLAVLGAMAMSGPAVAFMTTSTSAEPASQMRVAALRVALDEAVMPSPRLATSPDVKERALKFRMTVGLIMLVAAAWGSCLPSWPVHHWSSPVFLRRRRHVVSLRAPPLLQRA